MTTFLEDESSAEDNRPLEFYEIVMPSITYRHCSGTRDALINDTLYTAIPISRTTISVNTNNNTKELTVTIPITHAFVSGFINRSVPPKKVTLRIFRMQRTSGELEQIWSGIVTSVATEGRTAMLRVPSRAAQIFLRVIPNVSMGQLCPHVLYDDNCGVDRTSVLFKVTTTLIYVNGRDIRLDIGSTAADQWSVHGELVHVSSGMRMAIRSQEYINLPFSSVVDISLQMQIPGMLIGDSVEVYAGCDHTLAQCNARFANRQNFGGFPERPSRNPFIPGHRQG
jgi:uncharacterized phage protein (TIGR02218 family)